jgi:hypothetical protein
MSSGQFLAAVVQIREMFPQHSDDAVEAAIQECHGNIEAAISHLLTHTTESVAQGLSSDAPARPPTANERHPWHFTFGPDFLRWPANAPTIKVQVSAREEEPSRPTELAGRMAPIPVTSAPAKSPASRKPSRRWFNKSKSTHNSWEHLGEGDSLL